MQKKRWILCSFLVLLLLALSSVAFAAEATSSKPLRLARVPLVVRGGNAGADVQEMLEDRLDLALHVPLNDTMHYVEELPSSEVEAALDEVLADLSQGKKRVKMKDAMPALAEKLDADLVVCPVLTNYYEYVFYGGFGLWCDDDDRMRLESYVALELDGYDRSEQKNFSKSTSRFYHDTYSPSGRADALAKGAIESLVKETDINRRIMRPLKERAGK